MYEKDNSGQGSCRGGEAVLAYVLSVQWRSETGRKCSRGVPAVQLIALSTRVVEWGHSQAEPGRVARARG